MSHVDADFQQQRRGRVMDRVEYGFAVATLTGFVVLIAGMSLLML
ncbi:MULTISPECIES: hypothetical protein [Bradyrhizobium]|nr:hypothetical protein [Bradyrhizobium canariense]MBM7485952.1 hypothetical protein [Bradyrhizobium canariense]